MSVGGILLVCWQSCSIAAVSVDEDGIVLAEVAVGTSEWLPYWVEAMVIVGMELAFYQTPTVSNDVTRRREVASASASHKRAEIRIHICVWYGEWCAECIGQYSRS